VIDGLLVLGAGLLGVVVGLAAGLAFRFSDREQHGMPTPEPPELDEGVSAVLAVLPFAAVVTDRDGRVVRASAAAHVHGLVLGDRVVHTEVERLLSEVARDGELRDIEVDLPRGPVRRTTMPFHVWAAPLGVRHLLLLAEDRTEARKLDAIRRDFVVNASHELKTPVGALALLAETVGQAADDPAAVRRFATRIEVEAERLSALVQDILQLSRVQEGEPPESLAAVHVGAVIAEAHDRVRTAAAAKDITIQTGGEPATVLGDHDLLVTVVRNLLDNALAYSEPGTRVAVGTTVRADDGVVEIAVVDQGIGIPASAQSRLFERFYRVDPARSRDTGGTGLGLSIVKHVVADHGGEVTVWSEPGRGSTFTVRLPLAPDQGES
jgi:two-component system sensor histidine kinase SenX3